MDFDLDDDHRMIAQLADEIFSAQVSPAHAKQIEREHGGFDRSLWLTLAQADLLGAPLPESEGGSGAGMVGLCALLEQQGRHVAPVPIWSVVATGGLVIAEHGSDEQRARWLPGLIRGELIVVGAFDDAPGQQNPLPAHTGHGSVRVSGSMPCVAGAPVADAFVLPLRTEGGVVVAIVPRDRSGLTVEPVQVTSHESCAHVHLDEVAVLPGDLLPVDGSVVVADARVRARTAVSALASGVTGRAVAITAEYTSEREQFGRPLSANQAVAQRAADAHLDAERIRLAALKAAWHVDRREHADAHVASLVAKWWASVGGLRVVHATQHLHGGMGADVDYPIHRYFLWGRQIAFTMGSAAAVQAELATVLPQVDPIGSPA